MSYEIDGEQYLAVAAGFGGALNGSHLPGWVAAERENRARLLVFKLGAKGQPALPPLLAKTPLVPAPARYRGTSAQVARGQTLFGENCARCHSGPETPSGYPNLWKMTAETHDAFLQIVREGAFTDAGMASFGDVLSERDARDIHAYIAAPQPKAPPPIKSQH
jgi:quinohemoprotein ethanol dehydrogenase